MKFVKNTKIVATLSPQVGTKKMLGEFIDRGVNVFRLNFSHGTYPEYETVIANIKEVRAKKGVAVAILQDLQGPRVRVANLTEPVEVKKSEEIALGHKGTDLKNVKNQKFVPLDHDLVAILKVGEMVTIEDGLIEMEVVKVYKDKEYVVCEMHNDAIIKGRKGVNFPGTSADFPVITKKDKEDLKFGLSQEVDFVAMSFVRSAQDIKNLRKLIAKDAKKGKEPAVVAKIEKPDAVAQFSDILEEVDGVMVARGDLGIEVPAEQVPMIQKCIVSECLDANKYVIVATQMLDSMIKNPRPTRAEVSDVANAVLDHTDAVMLSGETSGGEFPLKSVEMMSRIVFNTEESVLDNLEDMEPCNSELGLCSIYDELAYAAQHLANRSLAMGIVVLDPKGYGIANLLSRYRPEMPIFTVTNNDRYYYKSALAWGVNGILTEKLEQVDEVLALKTIRKQYFGEISEEMYFVVLDARKPNQESIRIFMV
jgi:pyruvate kinase